LKNELTNIFALEPACPSTIEKGNRRKNLYQINFLRAVASISVCLFHLACGNPNLLGKNNLIYQLLDRNDLRVNVFFIVSGFIICYTLPTNYQLRNFGSFFKKRLMRVEPPYLMSILLTLIVAYIASLVTHNLMIISWKNLLYHIGYLNNFTTNTYINVVYWTLGIEFQFYIIIGLLFPFINKSVYFLTLIIISLLASSYIKINNTSLIFEHLPLFSVGILMYFISYNKNKHPKSILICLMLLTLFVIALSKLEDLYVSLFTICIISIPFPNSKLIGFLSKISYSLYLIHVPIGGRIINLSLRFVKTDSQRYLTIAIAFALSIIVAYLFHFIIEKPAIKWSKNMRYFSVS
jgi:peptidoglycan/LPS O-acetylase OafA/YrhL